MKDNSCNPRVAKHTITRPVRAVEKNRHRPEPRRGGGAAQGPRREEGGKAGRRETGKGKGERQEGRKGGKERGGRKLSRDSGREARPEGLARPSAPQSRAWPHRRPGWGSPPWCGRRCCWRCWPAAGPLSQVGPRRGRKALAPAGEGAARGAGATCGRGSRGSRGPAGSAPAGAPGSAGQPQPLGRGRAVAQVVGQRAFYEAGCSLALE